MHEQRGTLQDREEHPHEAEGHPDAMIKAWIPIMTLGVIGGLVIGAVIGA